MANKWQLNDAKQIAYFDANGDRQFAKEVWYIGEFGNYKIWPEDIYLKDVYVIDNAGNKYDYYVDEQGEPIYIDVNGHEWTGLSAGVTYYVYGTIVVTKTNGENEEYENCYLEYLTFKEYNGIYDGSSVWKSGQTTSLEKFNEMFEDNVPYAWFQCNNGNNKGLVYLGEDDDNVYFIPQLGYRSLKGDPNDGYYLNFGRLGEGHDPGAIKLKRAPVSRQFIFDNQDITSNLILGKGESVESTFVFETKDLGPRSGDVIDRTRNANYFQINNDYPDIFNITLSEGHLKAEVINPEPGENNYEWSISMKQSIYGYSDGIHTFQITVLGISYVIMINDQCFESNTDNTFEISKTSMVTIKKAVTFEEKQTPYSEWTTVNNFTLESDDNSIIGVSGDYLNPYGSGVVTITVTDDDEGNTFDFICNVEVEDTPTFIEVSAGTTTIGTYQFPDTNVINISRNHIGPYTQYVPITIKFKTASSGGVNKNLYHTIVSGNPYSYASGTNSTMSITMRDTTSQVMEFEIYKSNGGEQIGTLTINYL